MKVISHNKILQSIYMIDCTLKPDLRCNFRQQYQSIINEIMTLIHYKFFKTSSLSTALIFLWGFDFLLGKMGVGYCFLFMMVTLIDINQNFYRTGKVAFLLLLNQFLNTDSIIIKRDVHARFTSVHASICNIFTYLTN